MKMLTTMTYRMPNFTLEQKLYLLRKIHSVVDTVQDFRKDTNTTVYRNAIWAELVQAFNDAFPNRPPSSVGSLKTLWKRLKVECRMALQRRQEQQAAGMPLTALTQVQQEVMALVPNLITDTDGEGGYSFVTHSSPGPVTGGTNGNEPDDLDQNDELDSKELVAINLGLVSPIEHPQNSASSPGPAPLSLANQFFTHSTSRATSHRPSQATSQELESKELAAINNLGLPSPVEQPQDSVPSPGPAPLPLPLPHQFHTHSTSRATSHRPSLSRVTSGFGPRSLTFDFPRRGPAPPRIPVLAPAENSFSFADARGLSKASLEVRKQEVLEQEHQQTMSLLLLQQCVWEEKRRAARQKEKAARAKKRYYQAKLRRLGAGAQSSTSDSDEEYART